MRTKEEIEEALKIQSSNAAQELKCVNKTTGSIKDMHSRRYNAYNEKAHILKWVLGYKN